MLVPRMKREVEGKIEIAVLISPGFGAGWSTWCHDEKDTETLLFHKDLVQLVLEGKNGSAASLAEEMTDAYVGGAESLMVVWIPEGCRFIIHEYDGSENLVREETIAWSIA